MTILLAIGTVSALTWIVTREAIFADLRSWAKGKRGLYPLSCVYCLTPWAMLLFFLMRGLPWDYFLPSIWLSYHSIALFARLRG